MLSLRVFTALANQKEVVLLIPVFSPLWPKTVLADTYIFADTINLLANRQIIDTNLWT